MFEPDENEVPTVITRNLDPAEAALEAREINKYLLAKSFFDCREYDRCAAVFLPRILPTGPILNPSSTPFAPAQTKSSPARPSKPSSTPPTRKKKGKASIPKEKLPPMSQKALFLALYAKFMAGEKRKDEESEMILGTHDGGVTMNREIGGIIEILTEHFADRASVGANSQGWLEYLYVTILQQSDVAQDGA